jgi:hypothetical protein
MTATRRRRGQPRGPQPNQLDVAFALSVLTDPNGPFAGYPAEAAVAAVIEDHLRRLADNHRNCQVFDCTRCELMRRALSYAYALEVLAGT